MHFEPVLTPNIIFSDTVIREEGSGKLSIIGSFQHFNVRRFPFIAPPFVVTVSFCNLRGKGGKLPLSVRIENVESGQILASVSSEIRLRGPLNPTDAFDIPFGMPPCQFPAAGIYSVVFSISNEAIGQRPLVIRTAPEPPLQGEN